MKLTRSEWALRQSSLPIVDVVKWFEMLAALFSLHVLAQRPMLLVSAPSVSTI